MDATENGDDGGGVSSAHCPLTRMRLGNTFFITLLVVSPCSLCMHTQIQNKLGKQELGVHNLFCLIKKKLEKQP